MRNKILDCDTFEKTNRNCPICKWELIDCCANFGDTVVDMNGEDIGDYFMYCGNKACVNHAGVYYLQEDPVGLMRIK